ncbi:pyridoxal 5'-phosphate synthase glutaminase subunit PdxT [Arthrobacter caoxuetaonis]|uniref:pyridoxal 5'-phosphate synthase glutaminase subunit PdxT n=1 Tax=Arthrobacter caoxuetaonis TaxID=2886935 RepID=UPI001D13D010|nr:pyridoxal 5'-phosphate synthase glutaminase subunit PdxT [Arthrobacter caoxuetaonis]MCC3282666.1 pyridoxal 5'-phosphate synthase glutaminase subunit PdxT [Arthrobacter caoxuetaonis]
MTEITTRATAAPLVGVLALQGGVREHVQALEAAGARTIPVRRASELDALDGLVLPGGESTTIDKLMRLYGIAEPLRAKIRDGFPVYGSCAGMILLADRITDPALDAAGEPQQTLGGLDLTVRRNAFGRQRESFETTLDFDGLQDLPSQEPGRPAAPVHAVFIRAPWVEKVGSSVQVLAKVLPQAASTEAIAKGRDSVARIVAVRSGKLLATSFHPEVTGERRIHELFIQMIRGDA